MLLYLEPCGISKCSFKQSIRLCSHSCRINMMRSVAAWLVGAIIERNDTSSLDRITETDQCLLLTTQKLVCDRFTWSHPCWSTLQPKPSHNAIENEIMSLWASTSSEHYNLLFTYMDAGLDVAGPNDESLLSLRALIQGLREDPPMFLNDVTEYDYGIYERMNRLFRNTGIHEDIPMLMQTTDKFLAMPICGVVPIAHLRTMCMINHTAPSEGGWVVKDPGDILGVSREFAISHRLLVEGVWEVDCDLKKDEMSATLNKLSTQNKKSASQWSTAEVSECIRKEFTPYIHMIPHIESHGLCAKKLLFLNPSELCMQLGDNISVLLFVVAIRKRLAT